MYLDYIVNSISQSWTVQSTQLSPEALTIPPILV